MNGARDGRCSVLDRLLAVEGRYSLLQDGIVLALQVVDGEVGEALQHLPPALPQQRRVALRGRPCNTHTEGAMTREQSMVAAYKYQ